jgi:hypothetical protein
MNLSLVGCRAFLLVLLLASVPATAASSSNTLRWKAASEKGTFGYIVYRSENRDGPFLRINPAIIRGGTRDADSASDISEYRFEDTEVKSGQTYYYFIDVISNHGRKQRLSGVKAKKVP